MPIDCRTDRLDMVAMVLCGLPIIYQGVNGIMRGWLVVYQKKVSVPAA
jgi:hypothetical protein